MKSAQNILATHSKDRIIYHIWGQSPVSVYNSIVTKWIDIAIGESLIVVSNKKFGLKTLLSYLKDQSLNPIIIGKDSDGTRIVELAKNSELELEPQYTTNLVQFEFNDQNYVVNTGEALFSRNGLDEGSRELLAHICSLGIDFNDRAIADLGSGWGALSVILTREYPKTHLVLYEKDQESLRVSRVNLTGSPHTEVKDADLADKDYFETLEGKYDYIISNPPFHTTNNERRNILGNARSILKPEGILYFVSDLHFSDRFGVVTRSLFATVKVSSRGSWVIYECTK